MKKPNPNPIARMHRAMAAQRRAEHRLAAVIVEGFPAGCRVRWRLTSRSHGQRGVLLRHSRDRVYVRNQETGREYWMYAFNLEARE